MRVINCGRSCAGAGRDFAAAVADNFVDHTLLSRSQKACPVQPFGWACATSREQSGCSKPSRLRLSRPAVKAHALENARNEIPGRARADGAGFSSGARSMPRHWASSACRLSRGAARAYADGS